MRPQPQQWQMDPTMINLTSLGRTRKFCRRCGYLATADPDIYLILYMN
ncbi:hypothetical protein D918_02645 [Trichuris suis]|nr:hypothetical protein D918_02645 [Trichuris suis]